MAEDSLNKNGEGTEKPKEPLPVGEVRLAQATPVPVQVKHLAERLDCRYIARPTNEDAKAGNLNLAAAVARSAAMGVVLLAATIGLNRIGFRLKI